MKLELQVEGILEEKNDVYDAEKQITLTFPQAVQATYWTNLKRTCEQYLKQSETHVRHLEQLFASLDCKLSYIFCKGMNVQNITGEARDAGLL